MCINGTINIEGALTPLWYEGMQCFLSQLTIDVKSQGLYGRNAAIQTIRVQYSTACYADWKSLHKKHGICI